MFQLVLVGHQQRPLERLAERIGRRFERLQELESDPGQVCQQLSRMLVRGARIPRQVFAFELDGGHGRRERRFGVRIAERMPDRGQRQPRLAQGKMTDVTQRWPGPKLRGRLDRPATARDGLQGPRDGACPLGQPRQQT
jgi:hypothetical protein